MSPLRANALLLLAAFFWGSGNVAQKTVLDGIGPLTAVGLRCLIGAVVVLPFVWLELATPARPARPRRLEMRGIFEVAALFALAITVQQAAYATTSVTNASFLVSTTTVMTPLVAWTLLGTRPTPALWLAVAAALAGAFLMSGGSMAPFAAGDLGCLLSALFYSFWFVKLGQVVSETGRPGIVSVAQFALTGAVCLTLGLSTEAFSLSSLWTVLPDLLVLGVFATGLAFGLQSIAQQYTSASTAAVLTSAESVFGAAAAALLLGERLTPSTGLGAALVLVAILTVQLAPAQACRTAAAVSSEAERLAMLALSYVLGPRHASGPRGSPRMALAAFGDSGTGLAAMRRAGSRLDAHAKHRIVRAAVMAVAHGSGEDEEIERLCDVIIALQLPHAEAMSAVGSATTRPDVRIAGDTVHLVPAE